jgi:hypothetical protein
MTDKLHTHIEELEIRGEHELAHLIRKAHSAEAFLLGIMHVLPAGTEAAWLTLSGMLDRVFAPPTVARVVDALSHLDRLEAIRERAAQNGRDQ